MTIQGDPELGGGDTTDYEGALRWIGGLSHEERVQAADVLIEVWMQFDAMPKSRARNYALHLLETAIAYVDPRGYDDDDVDLDWEVWGELLAGLRFE